ncbi:rmlC-like jelly roll fold protein [Artemisia annua]|uniref:RmlC-like jelly roll fold protein n=1 Tax=Artemisia annua TaxID=35608 RepID=A0A2U1KKL6_ARTAN|nr:rmlC-like jelly roll fold protein [Artemisia annua]
MCDNYGFSCEVKEIDASGFELKKEELKQLVSHRVTPQPGVTPEEARSALCVILSAIFFFCMKKEEFSHRAYATNAYVTTGPLVKHVLQVKVDRPISTAVYFFLPTGNVSNLNRIPSAETWHFYLGEPITILEIDDKNRSVAFLIMNVVIRDHGNY